MLSSLPKLLQKQLILKHITAENPVTAFLAKRNYPQLPKRFYAEVTVSKNEEEGVYELNLDKRKLKTPGKRVFQVKSEGLAHAIATEWSSQNTYIQQSYMHLTALANTVLDNPLFKTKFDLVNEILNQVPEDTIIYRAPETNNKLLQIQTERWDPVVHWFEEEFKLKIPIVATSILPPDIPDDVLAKLRSYLSTLSFESVQGLAFAIGAIRSVILPIAVTKGRLSLREAVELGRLETSFQIDHWGNVEWAHDVELQDTLSRVAAGILFYEMHQHPTA